MEQQSDIHRKFFMKGVLKKWFYYHDRTQHAAKGNHSDFINILNILADYGGESLGETPDTWFRIKKAIDGLNYEQTEFLHGRVCRFKTERFSWKK